MKLYTEEQLKHIINGARLLDEDDIWVFTEDYLISRETPIKLPSDEEIENYADFAFPNAEKIGKETYSAYRSMKIGAKWVIEQIKQQDK